jgi:hypothetical protein
METLKGGVHIIKLVKRSELNGLAGDITSYDTAQERYTVTLRGADSSQPVLSVKRENLLLLVGELDHEDDEKRRQLLLERSIGLGCPQHLLRRAKTLKLFDEANYYICRHRRGELPPKTARRTHLLMIQQYYASETHTWKTGLKNSFLPSLAPYAPFPRFRQNGTSDAIFDVLRQKLNAAGAGEEPFDATLIIKALVYAEVCMGQSDAAVIMPPLNALWNAYKLIKDDDFADLVARAIDEEFRAAGAPDFNHKHLLWCICILYGQLAKDLRVRNPGNMEIRSHVSSVFIIVVSKTSSSYFLCLHFNRHISSTRQVPIDKLSSLN